MEMEEMTMEIEIQERHEEENPNNNENAHMEERPPPLAQMPVDPPMKEGQLPLAQMPVDTHMEEGQLPLAQMPVDPHVEEGQLPLAQMPVDPHMEEGQLPLAQMPVDPHMEEGQLILAQMPVDPHMEEGQLPLAQIPVDFHMEEGQLSLTQMPVDPHMEEGRLPLAHMPVEPQMEEGELPLALRPEHLDFQSSSSRRRPISKVPPYIRNFNSDAYTPRVVSIGPLHYGNEHLMPMEEHKRNCASVFMEKSGLNRQLCYRRFCNVSRQLMEHYELSVWEWNEHRFAELMIVDGCFLLYCFFSRSQAYGDRLDNNIRGFIASKIPRDFLLIENQLPMEVLLTLLEFVESESAYQVRDAMNLSHAILDFFNCGRITVGDTCLHVLDVYWKSMLGEISTNSPSRHFSAMDLDVWSLRGPKFPTATVLSQTGLKFKENEIDNLKDINFDGRCLSLPGFFVDQDTESLYLNLMAMERFSEAMSHRVSSHVDFMGVLIRSAQDVRLLRSHGIIKSEESDDVVANLFNELTRNPVLDPDGSLFGVRRDLARSSEGYIRRCNERLADWGSNFMKTYCKNIWTVIGLLAGAIILVATVTQAVFAVLQYYQKDRLPTARNP